MTRLMEMMGLGVMPRIVFNGDGGGADGGPGDVVGMDKADEDLGITSYSAEKGEIGGVVGADGTVATGDQLTANVARAKARSALSTAEKAAKGSKAGSAAQNAVVEAAIAYDQAVQEANKQADMSLAASNPNPELAAFRPKSRPKSVEAKAKAAAEAKAAAARAATIAATATATGLTKEAVEANINSATNTDDKWGYTKADGTVVSAFDDSKDGGGINSAGAGFARSGGRAADTNADGFVTAEEAEAAGGLQGNFFSGISNSIGATPYGSGIAPTGLAAIASMTPGGMLFGALRDIGRGGMREDKGYTRAGPGYTVQGQSEGGGSNDSGLVDEGMPSDQFRRENTYSTRPTSETYTRRYKGGGLGAYSPSYLRQYASGQKINELVREVTLADGSKAYLTPDGKYLEMDQFANTATGGDVVVDTGEERYVSGYKLTDAMGNVTEYDAAGNPALNYDPDQLVPLPNPYPELFDPDYVRNPPRAGFDPYNPFGAGI